MPARQAPQDAAPTNPVPVSGPRLRAVLAALLLFSSAAAQLCQSWSEGVALGSLDETQLPEASGLAASSLVADRLYHVNDSGDETSFYLTGMAGDRAERVRILSARSADVEDLALGPCGAEHCLFIADIGDNRLARETLAVFVVEEKRDYGGSAALRSRVILRYPDGPHDAEGFAVHPSGYLYLLTKAQLSGLQAAPARLYTLPRGRWEAAGSSDAPQTLDFVRELDLRALSGLPFDLLSHVATALDFSPDGERLLVLSYGNAYEIRMASLKDEGTLEFGRDYQRVPLRRLPQQESAAYLPDGRSVIYSSEARGAAAELVRVDCLD